MPFCICNYIELLFINKYVCKVITYSPIDRTMSPVLGQLPNIFFIYPMQQLLTICLAKILFVNKCRGECKQMDITNRQICRTLKQLFSVYITDYMLEI